MRFRLAAVLAAVVLGGCAALQAEEADRLLIDHGSATGLSLERTGVLFGSIGFAPSDPKMSAISLHLKPVDGKGHRFEIFATNLDRHPHWRTPDVDGPARRLWAFSGRLPVGRYEISLVGVSGADPRDVHWTNFKPAIPVTVTSDGAVYLGRWQFTPAGSAAESGEFRVPGTDLVLRDTPEEDQLLLVRQRGTSPVGKLPIDDVLRDPIGAGRT